MCGLERQERLLKADLNEYVLGGFLSMEIFHLVPSGVSICVWGGVRTFPFPLYLFRYHLASYFWISMCISY